ncbi:MAG TPA: SufD family Fe-S cluster assembly protein [Candidatus Woesebacteria bacterium]|nr:SufD family Fe-S cluster assembly protein [Candidatus Woesebacteria bacterium]
MKFIDLNKTTEDHVKIDKTGKYVAFFHNRSGKLTFELSASGIELYIYGLFTGKKADEFHIETIQHHTAPGSLSDLLIKGVFDDDSKFVYQGLIRLEKSAQQSHAYQKNQNLILSSDVFVDSRPFLEILANDVFCTHGSTTGKLNKDQIFYAISRGLSQKSAQEMLVQGFIDEIYDKVKEKAPSFNLQ